MTIKFISCCYNESGNLAELYSRIKNTMAEVKGYTWSLLIVDDGSQDDTALKVKGLLEKGASIEYIKLTRNFGKDAAITAGLDLCGEPEAIILIDGDLQHPPETIPHMITKWESGEDMVVALPKERKKTIFDAIASKAFHKTLSLSSHEIIEGAGDFRLLALKQIKRIRQMPEKSRCLKGIYSYPGGKVSTVEYIEEKRASGNSAFSLFKKAVLAINGITATTAIPIRAFSFLGFAILFFSFLYLIYIGIEIVLFGKPVPGFASLLFSIVILNGLVIIQVGILGEYVSQILTETKQRPIYVIDEHLSIFGE